MFFHVGLEPRTSKRSGSSLENPPSKAAKMEEDTAPEGNTSSDIPEDEENEAKEVLDEIKRIQIIYKNGNNFIILQYHLKIFFLSVDRLAKLDHLLNFLNRESTLIDFENREFLEIAEFDTGIGLPTKKKYIRKAYEIIIRIRRT
jgi:hypothetical protein